MVMTKKSNPGASWQELGRRAYNDAYLDLESAWKAFGNPDASQEDYADFAKGYEDTATEDGGGDFITFDLRDFGKYFAGAATIQRRYSLSESTVRKACEEGRVRCWKVDDRTWVVFVPDADLRWGKK